MDGNRIYPPGFKYRIKGRTMMYSGLLIRRLDEPCENEDPEIQTRR
jgi:hypothetical protein